MTCMLLNGGTSVRLNPPIRTMVAPLKFCRQGSKDQGWSGLGEMQPVDAGKGLGLSLRLPIGWFHSHPATYRAPPYLMGRSHRRPMPCEIECSLRLDAVYI